MTDDTRSPGMLHPLSRCPPDERPLCVGRWGRKWVFLSFRAAERAAGRMQGRDEGSWSAYRCRHCGRFHAGTVSDYLANLTSKRSEQGDGA